MATAETERHILEMNADQALFEGEIQGIVATFHENERPLMGLAGQLDWRFHGGISQYLREGAITGKPGECVYVPFTRHGKTYHVILAGAGHADEAGKRGAAPPETFRAIQKSLLSLRLPKIGVSREDLGGCTVEFLAKQLKGVPLWIVP